MLRFSTLVLSLLFFTAGFASAPAAAQPTRMLDEFDLGEDNIAARLLFFEEEREGKKEICLVMGCRRGSRSLNRNDVFVTRRVRPDEAKASGRLKFKFGSEPDTKDETFNVWRACVATPGPAAGATEDVLEISIRGGEANGANSRFFAQYPPAATVSSFDLHYNNSGGYAGGGILRPLTTGAAENLKGAAPSN